MPLDHWDDELTCRLRGLDTLVGFLKACLTVADIPSRIQAGVCLALLADAYELPMNAVDMLQLPPHVDEAPIVKVRAHSLVVTASSDALVAQTADGCFMDVFCTSLLALEDLATVW